MAVCGEGTAALPSFGSEPCEGELHDAAEQHSSATGQGPSNSAEEDELCYSAAMDRVLAVAEQVEDFLARFSPAERQAIQEPLIARRSLAKVLRSALPTSPSHSSSLQEGSGSSAEAAVDPHIDEAQRFVCTYLAMFPESEQSFALDAIGMRPDQRQSESAADFLNMLNMRRKLRLAPIRKIAKANTAARELWRLKSVKSGQLASQAIGQGPITPEMQRVIETFELHDPEGSGTIQREQLSCVLKMLNPVLVEKNLDSFLARRWCSDCINYVAFAAWVFQEEGAACG